MFLWLNSSYLCPDTVPSFLPESSSKWIPHHVPTANCTSPKNFNTPGRLPNADETITRSPM